MEKKYPIHINLLEEEYFAVDCKRNFLFGCLLLMISFIACGFGCYIYLNEKIENAYKDNQYLILQAVQILPDTCLVSDNLEVLDLLLKKDIQVLAVASQNPSKTRVLEDIEKAAPQGIQLNEINIADKIIITGLTGNYSLTTQFMAGLQFYPYLDNLSFSASNQDDNRIDFKIEIDWKGIMP